MFTKNGKPAKFNSDGIALTPDYNYLYFKPLSDDKLYRIKTAYLRDSTLPDQAYSNLVEDLGHFNTTDGMIFDKHGNLYMGDLEKYSLVKIDPQLKKNHADTRFFTHLARHLFLLPVATCILPARRLINNRLTTMALTSELTPYKAYRIRL